MADEHTPDEPSSDPASEGPPAHHAAPPGLPEIRDEAGDTPSWVPLLGVGLLVALLAVFGAQLWLGDDEGTEGAQDADATVDPDAPEAE
ncbi:MAG: hypothetical protein ACOCV4_00330 [Myxococcota bacterium]